MGVKRQQGSGDQKDLFDEALKASLRHGDAGDGGTEAGARAEPQAPTVSERQRALTRHLMEEVASSANLNLAYIEAMTASNDNRRVLTVKTWCDARKVIAEIGDTGPGIDPDSADRMFDAFVTTKSTGMGLGLAICRMIIERHGGRISVGTANPSGATFRIELPGNPQPQGAEQSSHDGNSPVPSVEAI